MFKKKTLTPSSPHHRFMYLLGMIILLINKLRYTIIGYKKPRPFNPTQLQRAIDYDRQVVTNWLNALYDYNGESIEQKAILELGPGADLGPALFLLDKGADKYITMDTNRLIDQTSESFYKELLKSFTHKAQLESELKKTLLGKGDRIRYIVDPSFNIKNIQTKGIDLVVSQAAFEHFNNIQETIKQLSSIVKSGGILIAEVDLMTHTEAIRSKDPLNIYRYSNFFYKLVQFSGIPNRLRPYNYKQVLEENDWYNIEVIPLQTLPAKYIDNMRPHLAHQFRSDISDMHILSFLIRATKR